MKKIAQIFFLVFVVQLLHAQLTFVKQWDKRFGGTKQDALFAMQQTFDGGYILGGGSMSGISGDKSQSNWDTTNTTDDYWIIKIDPLGNKQWDKRFGSKNEDSFYALQQTSDSGYILGGSIACNIGGDVSQVSRGGDDFWVVKVDAFGNKQWDKRFGGNQNDDLYALQQTKGGGYILGGYSNSPISGDKTQDNWSQLDDYWIVKIDSNGNKQWDKRFGGTSEDGLTSVQQTNDGGYILGGSSNSGISGDKTQNCWGSQDFDYWIVKIDSAGNKQWDKRYGGTSEEDFTMLKQTLDGGYILGGFSFSGLSGDKTQVKGGYWIVKIDTAGNKLWDKAFEGGTSFNSIQQTLDGGYLLGGVSYLNLDSDKTESNLGHQQAWVVKIDSAGKKEWDKTIFTSDGDFGGYAVQTNDGCYVIGCTDYSGIGGYKTQANWDPSDSTPDQWIVKFCEVPFNQVDEITNKAQLTLYPNPFTTDLNILLQKQELKQATFIITNPLGQIIYTRQENNLSPSYTKMLDLSYLPNGVYFVEVVVDGQRETKKVVKSGP